jgi:type II secretory pathway pseudopilin PulG
MVRRGRRPSWPKARSQRGLTLVEIVISAGLLAVVMLGVASTYTVISSSQRMTQERTAAILAAQSVMDEINVFVQLNGQGDWQDLLDTLLESDADTDPLGYDKRGFHVYMGSPASGTKGGIGSGGSVFSTTFSASTLTPADASLFPASRGDITDTDTLAQAGYIRILAPNDSSRGTGSLAELDLLWRQGDDNAWGGTAENADEERDDLRVVDITVAWKSAISSGSADGQVYRLMNVVTPN